MDRKKPRTLLWIAFCIYAVILVWAILFKFQLSGIRFSFDHAYRLPINLIPFGAPLENSRIAMEEMLFNAAAFVPLGVFLSALGLPKKWWGRLLAGFLVSLALEALQYATALGSADITDVILNTVGTGAGIILWLAIKKLLKTKAENVTAIIALIGEFLILASFVILETAN